MAWCGGAGEGGGGGGAAGGCQSGPARCVSAVVRPITKAALIYGRVGYRQLAAAIGKPRAAGYRLTTDDDIADVTDTSQYRY